MSETSTLIGYSGRTIGREELALLPIQIRLLELADLRDKTTIAWNL